MAPISGGQRRVIPFLFALSPVTESTPETVLGLIPCQHPASGWEGQGLSELPQIKRQKILPPQAQLGLSVPPPSQTKQTESSSLPWDGGMALQLLECS